MLANLKKGSVKLLGAWGKLSQDICIFFSHLWRIVSWEQWLSQILRILLDFYFRNSYHEHIGCRQDLLQWIKSGNNNKMKFAFGSKNMILLEYQKPFARESDLKLNQEQEEERQLMIFHNVWKLKSAYSGKTGCSCVHAATLAAKQL